MASPTSAVETVQRLFLQHAAALRGFILGLVGDREAAGDVFQEVFLTATRCAAQYRPEADFLPWARGIARNKVREHFRKSRRLPQPFDDELLDLLAEDAGRQDEQWEERRAALAECLQRLAPRARQIVELRYAEAPTPPPDIARRLAWTLEAVYVALARARKFLQECTRRLLSAGEK